MTAKEAKELQRLDRAAAIIRRTVITLLVIATAILIAGCVSRKGQNSVQAYDNSEKFVSQAEEYLSDLVILQAEEIILPVKEGFKSHNDYICRQTAAAGGDNRYKDEGKKDRKKEKPPDTLRIRGLRIEKTTCYSKKDSAAALTSQQASNTQGKDSKECQLISTRQIFFISLISLFVLAAYTAYRRHTRRRHGK